MHTYMHRLVLQHGGSGVAHVLRLAKVCKN